MEDLGASWIHLLVLMMETLDAHVKGVGRS